MPAGGNKKLATRFFMGESKKRTGRRPLTEGKKSRFVNVRFTEKEMELLERMEKELGLSRTEFIRQRALSNVEIILINSKELIAALDQLGRETGYIGHNINQLARHANTLHLQSRLSENVIRDFNQLFEQYLVQQQKLDIVMRKLMRLPASRKMH
ncbi:plasmid mobilization protein [Mucilaginibacter lacusdianchii]|uniref:plasmid mobilization protein n=1 Tax=Mucilaginibacter lacusdianchii TaxID=2684211 RepID=UPI00131DFFD2|nr:ribbon-helix-helix protein, CopG family [Mucilaginibacter sp. JXJ CY 39]